MGSIFKSQWSYIQLIWYPKLIWYRMGRHHQKIWHTTTKKSYDQLPARMMSQGRRTTGGMSGMASLTMSETSNGGAAVNGWIEAVQLGLVMGFTNQSCLGRLLILHFFGGLCEPWGPTLRWQILGCWLWEGRWKRLRPCVIVSAAGKMVEPIFLRWVQKVFTRGDKIRMEV